jgi:thiamine kinase-like enzyme
MARADLPVNRPPAELVERLAAILGEPSGEAEEMSLGITNRNYRLRLGGTDYVMRVTSPESALLGIDRRAERAAAAAAAALGVAPRVAAFLEDAGCLVTEFLPGRAVPPEELREPERLAGVARTVRAVHDGASFPVTFDAFEIVETYARTATARGASLPPDVAEARRVAGEIAPVLRGPEHAPVACHNDLLNANFILEPEGVRIVDWEYAGMGNRYFDLGNLSVNNGLGEDDDERLLAAYFGAPCTRRRFACLRLMRIMSDYREAMWGVVQGVISTLPYDYAEYAGRHFARLAASAADPRYSGWLRDAHGG